MISDNMKTIERSYDYCDKNNKGYLKKRELKICFLCNFGFKPSKFEINDILDKYGKYYQSASSGLIIGVGKVDVIRIMNDRFNFINEDDGIREIFQSFDSRCKGFIDINDFRKAVRLKYKHLNDLTIQQYFRELDTNSDGRVSFSEFHYMMCSLSTSR